MNRNWNFSHENRDRKDLSCEKSHDLTSKTQIFARTWRSNCHTRSLKNYSLPCSTNSNIFQKKLIPKWIIYHLWSEFRQENHARRSPNRSQRVAPGSRPKHSAGPLKVVTLAEAHCHEISLGAWPVHTKKKGEVNSFIGMCLLFRQFPTGCSRRGASQWMVQMHLLLGTKMGKDSRLFVQPSSLQQ